MKSIYDRRDGKLLKEIDSMHFIMPLMYPNRCDNEAFMYERFDLTKTNEYLEKKQAEDPNYKYNLFQIIVTALLKTLTLRPEMNRFIQGRRMYQRNEITISFVAKRQFKDGADEALIVLRPKDSDTLESISKKIRGDVHEQRKHEHAVDGVDKIMDNLVKLPMPLLALIVRIIRYLDFWGINPDFLTEGDPNYSTVTAET